MRPVRSAARVLLGAYFVASGARAIANPDPLVPEAKEVTDRLGQMLTKVDPRLPTDARTLVRINGAIHLGGALLMFAGPFKRPAAALLAASMIPTTLGGHRFWTESDSAERYAQQVHFLKNLGLLGGLLLAAADTEGRPGLKWRTEHFLEDTGRSVRRGAQTMRREARLAARAARIGHQLPG